jgi:ABC-type Fe3+/spermidine/putrescine transport system ATPase subunit
MVGRREPEGVRFVTATGLDLLVEDAAGGVEGESAVASVRPEAVVIAPAGNGAPTRFPNRVEGTVEDVSYVGASTAFRVRIGPELTVLVRRPNTETNAESGRGAFGAGDRVALGWPASASRVIRPA